jgi:flagellar hook-length control protein FliK
MSGPALNPIANIAPVAPAKGADATRPDTSTSEAADAPGKGFASELRRQMNSDAKKGDSAETDSKATAEADSAASAPEQQAPPPVQPELALLAGLMQPATPLSTAQAALDDTAAARRGLDIEPATDIPDAALAALTAAAGTGNPATGTNPAAADSARNPASLAAGLGDPAGTATRANAADLTGTSAGKAAELLGEAAPSNNFANIHAAALANLRGETTHPAPSPIPLHVATPAGSPGWPEEVGTRVSWMVGNEESHAHLTLTPPQLGKVEVSITVNGDQTTAQFVAATPAARELIEQSLPRLREILEQSGINLGQTDVGTSGQPGSSGEGRRDDAPGGNRRGDDRLAASTAPAQWVRRGEGLVDTFA